jgi:hypothetical protein
LETILTSEGVQQPVAFEAFFEAERVRLQRALYLLTGNKEEHDGTLIAFVIPGYFPPGTGGSGYGYGYGYCGTNPPG